MTKNVTVRMKPVSARISPLGLHMYAQDFLNAAVSMQPAMQPFSPVQYYLFLRSIELGLKAFLCAGGVTMKELGRRPYRHDLEKLLEASTQRGMSSDVPLEQKQIDEIRRANKYYGEKVFEYPSILEALKGYQDRPDVAVLRAAAELIVANTETLCLNAS